MHELLTPTEMAEADKRAIATGVAGLTLMDNAGKAVADAAAAMVAGTSRICVLAGPGNNGGDGFAAALHLRNRGFDVRLHLLGDRQALRGDAAEMARRWQFAVRPATPDALQSMHLVVDALFGAGLSRPIEGDAAELVAAVNASGIPVLAVDVPSGLDGASGAPLGPVIRARRTVTFARKKPGHLLMPGRILCGEVTVADIGITPDIITDLGIKTFENSPLLWSHAFPWPRTDGHKYNRGHAVVVSGPPFASGAARLGAVSALRAGAGLVTLIGATAATAINAAHMTSVMVRDVSGSKGLAEFLSDARRNAVLIGPGASVGSETVRDVLAILKTKAAVVLDADALTSFAGREQLIVGEGHRMGFLVREEDDGEAAPEPLFLAIRTRGAPVVLTPHDGEFKKLFGDMTGSKLERARHAAKLSGAIVVSKGADTVVAAPDGRAAVNCNAPPWLATAGSGDVLAGTITGLLAQNMSAFEAACAGVWLHGAAAAIFGPGLISEDLPKRLPEVLRVLHDARVV